MNQTLTTITANFSVLRQRNFRIYLTGQAVSLIGTWLQSTAQGWVVWKLTGSTVDLGVVSMLSTLPLLILTPYTGVLADRFDRRKLLIWTQVVAMLLAFILAVLVLTNTVQIWHIFGLAFGLGVVTALDVPAQQAFLGDLAGRSHMRNAINLNITILQISRMIGPALAGFIIGVVGAGVAFFLNGLSFLAVIYSLILVRTVAAEGRPTVKQSVWAGFNEAIRFVNSNPRLRDMILCTVFVTFFGFSIVLNLLPPVADQVLTPAAVRAENPDASAAMLGALMASSGAGALCGVVIFAPLVQARKRVGVPVTMAMMVGGLALLTLGSTNVPIIAMGSLFAAGLAFPSVMTTVMGLLQVSAPNHMRARVAALFSMVGFGLQPLAGLWVGWLASIIGVQLTIEVNALGLLVGAAFMFSRVELRRWEFVRPAEAAPVQIEVGAAD